ncbi:MAG: SDR family NAD(P)-dependent oxidoreductase [Bdellovibrionota bacterium]
MNLSVIITGASDGIGASLAKEFARKRYRLGLMARRSDLLKQVAEECRSLGASQVEYRSVDVTQSDAFRRMLGELDELLQGAGIFIANAGMGGDFSPLVDSGARAKKMIEVNVGAAIDGIEFMKVRMIQRRAGILAGVSSVAGARGLPFGAAYSATKAALSTYLEGLRIEMKPLGIRVVDIAPSFIDTAMTRDAPFPMPFKVEVNRAAQLFIPALLRGKGRIVEPWQYRPVYFLLKIIPSFIFDWIGAQMVRRLKFMNSK